MGVTFGTLRSSFLSALWSGLQFVLPTRPLPRPQSSAQLCNDDVLSIILEVLAPKDLCAVALTCRGWCPAAYRALYASVHFRPSWRKGTQTIDLLSRTLIASKDVRGLIRDLSLQSVSGAGRPEPDTLYDWLPLLPDNTVRSLHIFSSDVEEFLSLLIHSPMLQSVQYLSFSADESFFIGRNRMSEILNSSPNVSQVAVYLPTFEGFDLPQPDFYAPFAPMRPRIRHMAIETRKFTPLLADLLRVTHTSLESLHCTTILPERFHNEFCHALEIVYSSPLHTLHVYTNNAPSNMSFLASIPASWSTLREILFTGYMIPSALFPFLPTSLEILALGYYSYDPFPINDVKAFVHAAAQSHKMFRQLIILGVDHPRDLMDLPRVCSSCGISLHAYNSSIKCKSFTNVDGWKLRTMLKEMSPMTME